MHVTKYKNKRLSVLLLYVFFKYFSTESFNKIFVFSVVGWRQRFVVPNHHRSSFVRWRKLDVLIKTNISLALLSTDDVKFVSALDDAAKKKAKEELNELNDKDRALAVQTLRQWALQQKWLKTPTGLVPCSL